MKRIKPSTLLFVAGSVAVYAIVQVLFNTGILNAFWSGIIRLAAVMAMVSLGLNLIYGFNGQFSLGQFGFYAIGAYTAADITYRWEQLHSALGLTVVLAAGVLMGLAILLVRRIVVKMRGQCAQAIVLGCVERELKGRSRQRLWCWGSPNFRVGQGSPLSGPCQPTRQDVSAGWNSETIHHAPMQSLPHQCVAAIGQKIEEWGRIAVKKGRRHVQGH